MTELASSAASAQPAEPGFTLSRMLRAIATERPDAPAVSLGDTTLSFAELQERGTRIAALLQARGVGRGDRVAILDKNAPSFSEILFGTARLGAVLVGLNHRLAAPELASIVGDARPVVTFTDAEFRGLLPADLPCIDLGEQYSALRDAAGPGASPVPDVAEPGDVALQLYSSGTTGRPKGAMLTHANLSWTPKMGREFYAAGPASVNLVPSPLFHIGGVGYGLTTMGQGGHTVLVRDIRADGLLALIERHHVTHTFMVPSVIQMLIEHPHLATTDVRSLERIAYGGAPMSGALLTAAMQRLDCEFMAVYGMTETAGTVISMGPEDHDPQGERLRSIGRGVPWLEIALRHPLDQHECAPGEVGEICVRGPQNMLGYWAQPELTDATLSADNWLRTGDAASRDADGYIYLHDRIKDMIVSGGENIYPAEVEKVLAGHADVAEVAVIGVPSAKWGETVKAVVVLREDAVSTPETLITWIRERLAHYKCPTSIDVVTILPRNATGKVLKHQLRAPYWQSAPPGTP